MARNKIFVCDDQESIVELLIAVFDEFTDFEVVGETSSPRAYDRIIAEQANILIVDISMPILTGDKLIQKIRSGGDLHDLYIICMSANDNGKEVALAAGADLFLPKPFQLDDLLMATQRAS